MLMIGAADVLFVLMALDLLGMGEPGAGILNAALGAGFIVAGAVSFVFVGRHRLPSIAAAGACLWGTTLAISAWLALPWPATALIVAGGAGLAIVDVSGRTILQRSVRDDVLAGVFGLQEGLAMAALAVGSLMVPALSALLGLTAAIIVIAAILPVVVVVFWKGLVDASQRLRRCSHRPLRRVDIFITLPPRSWRRLPDERAGSAWSPAWTSSGPVTSGTGTSSCRAVRSASPVTGEPCESSTRWAQDLAKSPCSATCPGRRPSRRRPHRSS
jgi:hypothetical protein